MAYNLPNTTQAHTQTLMHAGHVQTHIDKSMAVWLPPAQLNMKTRTGHHHISQDFKKEICRAISRPCLIVLFIGSQNVVAILF